MTRKHNGFVAETAKSIAADRADWVVDAVATSTQDRRFLRGEPEEDKAATEAILLNVQKAIEVAIFRYVEKTGDE